MTDHQPPPAVEAIGRLEADIADSLPYGLTYVSTDDVQTVLSALRDSREALEPFAAYSQQMDKYAVLHRGKHLPDSKVLAYSETEMGTCAALVVGHFRDADAVFGRKAGGWTGLYRSTIRAARAALDRRAGT